jgi:hypothetical protein
MVKISLARRKEIVVIKIKKEVTKTKVIIRKLIISFSC